MKNIKRKAADKIPYIQQLHFEAEELKKTVGILQLEKGNLEADIRDLKTIINDPRSYLAHRFLRGNGIEIGPSYLPVSLPPGTTVKYVDHATSEELIKRYPELKKLNLAQIDVVDDAEKLTKFKNGSIDFVIANHFLEHCQDPIGTIINMYNKLRKNGILYFAIPDKRYTFDIHRPLTSYSHLIDEHKNPSFENKWQHYLEASQMLDKKRGKSIVTHAQELMDANYSIHYHVWTQTEMTELFLNVARDFNLNLEFVVQMKNKHEVICLLQKGLRQKGYRGN